MIIKYVHTYIHTAMWADLQDSNFNPFFFKLDHDYAKVEKNRLMLLLPHHTH